MPSIYKYFIIPFENVPANPTYPVWYASWTKERPIVAPGVHPPLVVGATTEALPAGATLLGSGSKDPPPPPPPPPPLAIIPSEYQTTITTWLEIDRGEDE